MYFIFNKNYRPLICSLLIVAMIMTLIPIHVSQAATVSTTLSGSKSLLYASEPVPGGGTVRTSIPINIYKTSNPSATSSITFRAKVYGEFKNGSGSGWGAYSSETLGPYSISGWNQANYTLNFNLDASAYKNVSRIDITYNKSGDTYIDYGLNNKQTATLSVTDTEPPTSPSISISSENWSTSQTVSIGGSRDNTEVDYYMYSINGGSEQKYTNPFTLTSSSAYTITAYAVDIVGLRSGGASKVVYVDSTPSSSPSINGLTNGYSNESEINISLVPGRDEHSGTNRTEYYLSGATSTGWIVDTSLRITNEGITVVHARSIDNVGNPSSEVSGNVLIDHSNPIVNLSEEKINAVSTRINVTASDGLSGVKEIYLPNGLRVSGNIASIVVTKNGNYRFIVTDQAGNSINKNIVITHLDETAPILKVQTLNTVWSSQITLSATATDAESGVDFITLPDGKQTKGGSATYTVSQNGEYTFSATDAAGNVVKQSIVVGNIDQTPPLLKLESSNTVWSARTVISATATDSEAGNDHITLPNGSQIKGESASYEVTQNGDYTFEATDKAGNSIQKTIKVDNIDNIPPVLKLESSNTAWSSSIILSATAIDSEDKVDYMTLPDGSQIKGDSASYEVTQNGDYTFEATDLSGNVVKQTIKVGNFDKTPPVLKVEPSDTEWATNLTLSATATDEGSGIDYMTLPDGSHKKAKSATYKVTKNGEYTFSAFDLAGNVVKQTIEVHNIDDILPTIQVKNLDEEWSDQTSLLVNASDLESGVAYLTLPDGKKIEGNSTTYAVSKNGTYTFSATDVVGNTIEHIINVENIDDRKPTVSVFQNGRSWSDQDIHVMTKFADAETGLDLNRLYYKWSDSIDEPSSWDQLSEAEQTIVQTKEGIWYLHLKGYDRAGNSVNFTTNSYQLQHKPETPTMKVIGTATDKMLLSWSLPSNGAEVDGTSYKIENQSTGRTWTVYYPANELSDDSLSDGSAYSYVITAYNHVGESEPSEPVIGTTLPGITVSANVYSDGTDYSKSVVNIAPVKSATGYHIQATNLTTQALDVDTTVMGDTYQSVSGLQPYTWYNFSIQAVNTSGEGAAYHVSYLSLPNLVSGFNAVLITEDSVDMNWNTVTQNVYADSVTEDTYYKLHRDQTTIYEDKATHFKDTGLEAGTSYNYDIAARNRSGFGNTFYLSNIWTLPQAPEDLNQVNASTTSITMKWKAVRGVDGYQAVIDDTYTYDISRESNQYTFTGFEAGSSHRIQISPYNKSGFGKSISSLGLTLPDQPDIDVSIIGEDFVTFRIASVVGATKYKLMMDNREFEVGTGEITVNGLVGGTTYDYVVAAGNGAGYGEALKASVLTLPSAPTTYTTADHSPTTLTVKWEPVKSADYYNVYTSDGDFLKEVKQPEYTATDLEPGSTTTFVVEAFNISGKGKSSRYTWRTIPGFVDANIDLSQLVHIDTIELSTFSFHWLNVPGADAYRIYNSKGELVQQQTTESQSVLSALSTATRYTGYTVVPVNTTGEGRAMPIPDVVTLPDPKFSLTFDSTRTSVTIHVDHTLDAEIFVIASQGHELFRGSAKGYHQFVQDQLHPDSIYTFEVWTENELGNQSEKQSIVTRTKKERESIVVQESKQDDAEATLIEEPTITPLASGDTEEKDESESRFMDIENSFAQEAIDHLANLGIVKGISENEYAPNEGTTRAQFMSMLTRLTLTPEQIRSSGDHEVSFNDIDRSAWYMPELQAAIEHGIAKGFNANDFKPDMEINREQAAKMLSGALYTLLPETDQMYYVDSSKVSEWAKQEVNSLTSINILQGYPDQSFRPYANLTRAESATMIERAMRKGMIEDPK
ncbi:hypothetical protein PaeCFBP13512_18490 [Paenibacillus sp. CFBP13512]|nr:hypothetical protein PaeCFBP13512_18490 [Paenibacillus sp. CFBP13512]